MYKTLVTSEPPMLTDELMQDLADAGLDILDENPDVEGLTSRAVRTSPDLVIAASSSPSDLLFETAKMLGTLAPCPFILFTADTSTLKIDRASESGVHAYIVNGYAKHRLRSIVQVARARFRHEQVLKDELSGLSRRFEERKIVDRAKGVLMRSRGVQEDEAFEMLRSLAMRCRQRIGVVAQSVVDMSRASEAVNRAGQLRMLSQRIVKCYAQCLANIDAETSQAILEDCVVRVEAGLGILAKAIQSQGYGDLVARVKQSWQEMYIICSEPPKPEMLPLLDKRADKMLKEAENLTDFLESSGLVSSLHVLNVSGRQRMLSQKIAKYCFILALEPQESTMQNLHQLMDAFEKALDYLSKVPLSTALITKHLNDAQLRWTSLKSLLLNLNAEENLLKISDCSEYLLDATEQLTDQYEQAIQMLVGDRLGHI